MIDLKALAERIRKVPMSEIDRSVPRMAKAICRVKLDEEEKALIVQLLEKESLQ